MATQEPVKSDQTSFLCDCTIRELGAGARDYSEDSILYRRMDSYIVYVLVFYVCSWQYLWQIDLFVACHVPYLHWIQCKLEICLDQEVKSAIVLVLATEYAPPPPPPWAVNITSSIAAALNSVSKRLGQSLSNSLPLPKALQLKGAAL